MSRPSYQVFTPPDVADRLWDRALEAVGGARTSAPRRLVAVEPAAGDGALIAAGERAVARHGVAVAVEAVELDAMLVAELRRRFPNTNITHADALTLARGAAAPASTPGVAASASSPTQVAGTSSSRLVETAWADLVIANPPYLRETGNRQFFSALRQWAGGAHAPLYRKDTDLHFYFWDIAQRWLAPGGVLAFLTPAYFLEAAAAAPLRAMLETTGELRAVWRAGRAQLFSDAGVEAAVTIWQKAASPRPAHATLSVLPNLQARLEQAHAVDLPDGRVAGDPWWTRSAPTLAALTQDAVELGDMFAIIEGVSTGLNRVRAQHLDLLPGAELGAGVLVLDAAELKRVGVPTSDPRLARRYPESTGEWLVRIADGQLPHLDAGEPPRDALERHLVRARPALAARAEQARSARRSWYATAWPRPELDPNQPALVTPKWAAKPSFARLTPGTLPMTDHRVLVPRTPVAEEALDRVLAHLQGPELLPWYESRLKRKGALIEWYGEPLARVPLPRGLFG